MDIMWTYMVSWAERIMSPPPLRQFASTSAMPSRHVTEDTPADLLEGTMDLTVILPAGHRVNMSVHRSTPMMDLLIQVTTAHKIKPGDHVIHVVSDNRLVSYKPSTLIGTLDTSVIQIVAKNKINEEARKRQAHLVTQAIEKNVRLKVNLPRGQLAVYRVPPKTLISDVLAKVCKDKGIDAETHEIRHPVNVDEKLRGSCTLADYQLQEVSVVSKDYHAPPLSVTDLITMAAISHPQDNKRRGLLSIFSRKSKSSTGESSVSSGSAGERSVSPARSDESADGRPTPRPVSLASSSTTLTSAQPQPQLSRPSSTLNLARSRKRQAPAPPPAAAAPSSASHTNGKDEGGGGEGGGNSLSRRSSDSSGYHEADQRSPQTSPAGSEISSAEAVRGAQGPQTTNLTSVVSTSSLSLSSSRGKRRAPPPPKPPPTRQDDSTRPSAIPEESESPIPPKSPVEDARPLMNGEAHHDPPQQPPDIHPSSPTSSHVSSVSSLSSVEQQQATSPLLPPPPDIECPPPPSSASECTNLGATFSSSPYPTSNTPSSNMTPVHQSFSATNKPPSPTAARATVAAGVTLGMQHEAATAANLNQSTGNSKVNSTASGVISPDRLAEPEGPHHHNCQDHQHQEDQVLCHLSSHEHQSASADSPANQKSQMLTTEIIQERDNLTVMENKKLKDQDGGLSCTSDGVSAKNFQNIDDVIMPQTVSMEVMPDIPTFRVVTKSHTGNQKGENDACSTFIVDGKTQKVSNEKFVTKGKSSKSSNKNPLARGKELVRQNNVVFDDDDDDMDFNEDLFEPKNVFGNSLSSVNLSLQGSPATDQNEQELPPFDSHYISTNIKKAASQPLPKKKAPGPPSNSALRNEFSNIDHSTPLTSPETAGHQNISNRKLDLSFEDDFVPRTKTQPKHVPVTQTPPKKRAPAPPVAAHRPEEIATSNEAFHRGELQISQDISLTATLRTKAAESVMSCDTSQVSHLSHAEEFQKIIQEPPDEEFNVHISGLSKIDPDMLSLLSEEGVDSDSYASPAPSRTPSMTSKMSDTSQDPDDAPVVMNHCNNSVKTSFSSHSSHNSSTMSSPVPPNAALPAPTTASSYRAGYLAMMADLKSWNSLDSLHSKGLELPESHSSSPCDSLQEQPKLIGSLQETSESSAQISPQVFNEGMLRGPPLRPRLASSSSLCSDTDHEVQTRTASFSSETSEENVVSRRVKNNAHIEDSQQHDRCPQEEYTGHENEERKQFINKRVSSMSQNKSTVINNDEVDQVLNTESVSSLSVTDSEGDSRGKTAQETSGKSKGIESVKTEVIEPPLPNIRVPDVEGTLHYVDALQEPSNHKISSRDMESYLQAALADLETESKSSEHSDESSAQLSLEKTHKLPQSYSDNSWDYKTPDPPTPFRDGPSSRLNDDSSSTSSETAPEILHEVPSGFKNFSNGSISESRSVNIIEKKASMKAGEESNESVSNVSSRNNSTSSFSSTYKSEEKAKQSVIDELKSTIKETNNNEPRIVELKPKTRGMETIVQMPKPHIKETAPAAAKTKLDVEANIEALSVRANVPVQYAYVPQVIAKVPVESKESVSLTSRLESKTKKESVSSYESCCDTSEPEITHTRGRLDSDTSYESVPPPAPDIPPPFDSDLEVRASRSSSDVSDGSFRTQSSLGCQNSDSGSEASKSRARVMNFSISTYTSRAEETSYDKKIVKSESFSHQIRPKAGHLSKTESFSTQSKSDQLIEENKELGAHNDTSASSLTSNNFEKPTLPQKPHFNEFSSAPVKYSPFLVKPAQPMKPAIPPNKPTLYGMHSETNLNISQPVFRVSSLSDRSAAYRNNNTDGHFAVPGPPRPLRRLQRADSQENLGRATSLLNLSSNNYELRKAQSSYDVSYGTGSNDSGSESGMPGMPGMAGMPGMFGMQSMGGGGGMMPHDARLAEEFMKLQQDFFKWQQQLLQNQHVLHSRVAPLASNPPQLQSVGVLRDIMSQSPSSANGAPELVEAHNPAVERKGPVERVINIQFIDGPSETDDSQIHTNSLPRLSQSVQDITTGMGQLSSSDSGRPINTQPRRWGEQPSVSVGAWTERPSQSVGVYQDRDYVTSAPRSQSTQDLSSTPVPEERQRTPPRTSLGSRGYSRPADTVSSETKSFHWPPPQQQHHQQQQSQYTQPQQYQFLPPDQQQQFAQFLQQQQQQQQQHPQQQWQQQQQPQQQWQQQQQPQQQWQQQQQPQQQWQQQQAQQPQSQYVQPQQQQPDKTAFWRELEGKRQNLGLHKDQEVSDPTRPPRRSSRQDSPSHDSEASKTLPCFGQQAVLHEPPQTYYYNGDGNSAQSVIANSVSAPKPKEMETEVGGPRYTSVVTLSSDKNEQPSGAPAPKDKVRSIVQLNSGDQRGQIRPAPVVRGFRQPGEEPPSQGGTIHSRIISNAIKGSQPSHSQTRSSVSPPSVTSSVPTALSGPAPEAPTAARLVAAVSQPSKAPSPSPATSRISPPRSSPSRISPPRVSPTRISPARTSPSRVSPPSGPAFPNVQLRPVPAGLRASTPPESYEPAPPQYSPAPPQYSPAPVAPSLPVAPPAPVAPPVPAAPPAPVNQTGSVPPPPPPAPPMAPPPPAAKAADGERRTASGKRIVSSKGGPELDAREELMMAIKQHGGLKSLKRTGVPFHH
ncbi:uncharacterized protein [Panulirus ornatus]|uniref:uncharacterized protein isoform X2 n=1 Tax=Panulirus ornatus TaxID=150431 RepID=UPI003A840283